MVLTTAQRSFVIESYFRSGRFLNERWIYSYDACSMDIADQFPTAQVPSKEAIRKLVDKFRTTGSVINQKHNRRPSRITENTVEEIRQRMLHSPNKSIRRLSLETGLSVGSCHKIVRNGIHMYPYRISVLHELIPTDHAKRIRYCQWFKANVDNNMLDTMFFTDEAWLHLSGYINSQNFRIWSTENPHQYIESPLHPLKIGIWIAISRTRIIGPIFFHETIDSERYCGIIDQFYAQLNDYEKNNCWFQQDSATSHTSRHTMNHLTALFNNRIIKKDLWPPRSPDLTPPDYFLFGSLKDSVFRRNPHTLQELGQYTTEFIRSIQPQILVNVFNNMHIRIQSCLAQNGGHFQHLRNL